MNESTILHKYIGVENCVFHLVRNHNIGLATVFFKVLVQGYAILTIQNVETQGRHFMLCSRYCLNMSVFDNFI